MRVLDVGCAKGFLVKDLMKVCPGLEAFGLDISLYALMHCEPEVVGRLHLGSAEQLAVSGPELRVQYSASTPFTISRRPTLRIEVMRRSSGLGAGARLHPGG